MRKCFCIGVLGVGVLSLAFCPEIGKHTQDLKQAKRSLTSAKPFITEALKSCETLKGFFKLNGDLDSYQRIKIVPSDIVNKRPSKQSRLINLYPRI